MKKRSEFDVLNDISEHVTLVQLMETIRNVNHSVSMDRSWIYDYNNENHSFLLINH